MVPRFGLTLMVNHACNLRCAYCYTGEKFVRRLPTASGCQAIDRALHSLTPGGTLDLGFFGGEPLLEADRIQQWIAYANLASAHHGVALDVTLTTNATLDDPRAWALMTLPQLRLAISCDGLPEVHDRHRVTREGAPTSQRVLRTMSRLLLAGQDFRVVLVVRPDNVTLLAAGLEYLYEHGVRQFEPSLDLWTTWTRADVEALRSAIGACADFWSKRLPECSVSWFDSKAGALLQLPTNEVARCGFGHGEIAVAPSGNLYPCERLIGADEPSNPLRLPGHVLAGGDFLQFAAAPGKSAAECMTCVLNSTCSTTCRCSNYVRTGHVGRPDGLLCAWDQACIQETARALRARAITTVGGAL